MYGSGIQNGARSFEESQNVIRSRITVASNDLSVVRNKTEIEQVEAARRVAVATGEAV
jgi:hypothetical protein